jgi:tRNA(adenine34) deaminase
MAKIDQKIIDRVYMVLALNEAKKASRKDEVPVGCVIVSNKKTVSKSHNLKEKKHSPIMHAEIIAIQKASKKLKRWRLSDCDIYVTLEPCPMCMGAILSARFKRLVFGAYDPKAGACGSLYNLNEGKLNHKLEVVSNILDDECSLVLKDYFKGKREAKCKT